MTGAVRLIVLAAGLLIAAPAQANGERLACSLQAARLYGLPPAVLLAVAEQEAGRPGLASRNSNGTYDLGSLQFNTSYIRTLGGYGIRAEHVSAPGCYPYLLAAWRIRRHVTYDQGDFWTRVANYHSRTPYYNSRYRAAIIGKAVKWQARLAGGAR